MVGAKLPELRRGDVLALVTKFSTKFEQKGDAITGTRRDGESFTIHMLHGKGLRPDQLDRALKYLGVTRAEFEGWRK
jgi:hypothetical protein